MRQKSLGRVVHRLSPPIMMCSRVLEKKDCRGNKDLQALAGLARAGFPAVVAHRPRQGVAVWPWAVDGSGGARRPRHRRDKRQATQRGYSDGVGGRFGRHRGRAGSQCTNRRGTDGEVSRGPRRGLGQTKRPYGRAGARFCVRSRRAAGRPRPVSAGGFSWMPTRRTRERVRTRTVTVVTNGHHGEPLRQPWGTARETKT